MATPELVTARIYLHGVRCGRLAVGIGFIVPATVMLRPAISGRVVICSLLTEVR